MGTVKDHTNSFSTPSVVDNPDEIIDLGRTPVGLKQTIDKHNATPVVAPPVNIAQPQPLIQAPRVQNMTQDIADGMTPVNPAVQRLKDLGYNDSDIQS